MGLVPNAAMRYHGPQTASDAKRPPLMPMTSKQRLAAARRGEDIPPSAIHTATREAGRADDWFDAPRAASSLDVQRIEGCLVTPRGRLTYINGAKRGHDTVWHAKPLVQSLQVLLCFRVCAVRLFGKDG